jgi:protein-tyrosine phosphatase
MSLRNLSLPPGFAGEVWLGSMPGRFESWSAFEREARAAEIGIVVCLAPRDELAELSPEYNVALVRGELPFRWMLVPMRNFGLPDDPAAFRRDIAGIAQSVRGGERVLLHCAAGLGRTGSAAACLLKALGVDEQDALKRVRGAGSNPQNAQQSGLVHWF